LINNDLIWYQSRCDEFEPWLYNSRIILIKYEVGSCAALEWMSNKEWLGREIQRLWTSSGYVHH
jgi:hypothetical protein